MTLWDSIKIAFSSIWAHKLRSALTMLGIIIGVGSIITVVAIGQGGEAALKSQIVGDGNNTISLQFKPKDESMFAMVEYTAPTFTQDSLFQIQSVPEVKYVIPVNSSFEQLSHNENTSSVQITGITQDYFAINKIKVTKGRSLTGNDFAQANNVVMLNEQAAKELYGEENPIGKVIEVKMQPFEIIGVYKGNDEFFGLGFPYMLLPLSIWPVMYGSDEIQSITLQAKSPDLMETAGQKAVDVLNFNKSDELEGKYEVQNLEEIKKGISKVTTIMTSIIGGIAGISLLVGGIGVMNIMLVSVTERTREIGIRKALGATRGKILLQFLIEAMMLTLLGGIIGIGLGVGGAYIVSTFAKWPPLVSGQVVLGGVLFSMTLGIIFGLIPANKAAKLDPIEALRYE
ncbi:ABC transporter permease [Ectobacillus antri]|jgi:putative ABC transport system permease protein|uniref:ABC transporter permease n=1 Tax=Ectobacillus antri TaxID=2486280 RepID=A0ABT6H8C4_9BACI|nr:ABC transporter permease [Ectobacillus antri]MDG4658563.1 ABC transporter permease [Ectobacillus antri]MDG5755567.1 ABC transporter permease [Ectobacillus antri]